MKTVHDLISHALQTFEQLNKQADENIRNCNEFKEAEHIYLDLKLSHALLQKKEYALRQEALILPKVNR